LEVVRLAGIHPEEDADDDDIDEGNSGEDEDVEAAALSMAAKLEGMTEIEQLEFQIKQLKMLQALKAGQDRTCPPGCKC